MKSLFKIFFKDDGYTFIETFITILILGLLSTIIYINSSTIQSFTSSSVDKLIVKNDLLHLKLLLKEEASRVKQPWFLSQYNYTLEGGILTLNYYNGLKNNTLIITTGVEGIIVESEKKALYSSKNLTGDIDFKDGFILYTQDNIEFKFPLGVIIVQLD
ncbi:hypothetical protein EW093_10180 [Thiospirochaeta perfilievii]|uniref:Prepilin-type N-terminal cleavage/methylation domain-containing protein n=1 Tax=Thiospirochaeta perfilievii TaxID=252967 RepID=A0A5C1QDB3_9SPIO|nr:hypothetical protein [Thiospirochaeta perfilievii]QEN05060.1 hypothetical protein EW093_10180 [Thiospirochaeta perfilievii]